MLAKYYNSPILYCLIGFVVMLLLIVDATSLVSYVYSSVLLGLFCRYIAKNEGRKLLFYYSCYAVIAIIFTVIFKEQNPSYLGMTGPEGGIGTDDCRYYAQIVSGKGTDYIIKVSLYDIFPYSLLLKYIYPFHVFTPLNIVLLSMSFSPLLVYYSEKLAWTLFNNDEVSKRTASLVFLCPFTTYFGCIIMRDIFTSMLVMAGLYYCIKNKYIGVIISSVLIIWVRFGSFVFLASGILIIYLDKIKQKFNSSIPFTIFLLVVLLGLIFSYQYIQDLSEGKLSDNFIRETGDYFEESTIEKITSLPFPINVIGGMLFFIFIPFLSFPHKTEGIYIVGSIFQGFLTPLFMFFLWSPIFSSFISGLKKHSKELTMLLLWTLTFATLLGTVSLQSRHKTVLFPLLCMLAAYGRYYGLESSKSQSNIMAFLLISIQIALAIKTIF